MTSKLNNSIASYSHGMKQRIALIAALVHKPALFILDEPFVGLDPTASFELKKTDAGACRKWWCCILFDTCIRGCPEAM